MHFFFKSVKHRDCKAWKNKNKMETFSFETQYRFKICKPNSKFQKITPIKVKLLFLKRGFSGSKILI